MKKVRLEMLLAILFIGLTVTSAMAADKPNIVMVLLDDWYAPNYVAGVNNSIL